MQLVHTTQMRVLRSIIDSVSDPIFVKDESHAWVELNRAFCDFMGQPRAALLGKSDYDFFPRHEADVFWQRDDLVFRSGEDDLNSEALTDARGVTRTVSTKKSVLVDRSGRRLLLGVFRDITKLRRARLDSELAGISKVIDDVRAFARNAELDERVSITLSTLLRDSLGLCGESLRGRGIALRLINTAPGVSVQCRATQVVQLLISLLNTARDSVADVPDPWIALRMSATGGVAELRVTAKGDALIKHGARLEVARRLASDNGGSLRVVKLGPEPGLVLRLPRAASRRKEAAS